LSYRPVYTVHCSSPPTECQGNFYLYAFSTTVPASLSCQPWLFSSNAAQIQPSSKNAVLI